MVSKPVANSMLLLRIVTLAASAVTVILVATNKVNFDDGTTLRFQDFNSYWYVVAVAAVAAAYCKVQLPFAIYYAVQQKRLIRNGFLPELDFYGDKVIAVLLGTGIGVGYAVSIEFKKIFDESFNSAGTSKSDTTRSTYDSFFNRGIIASSILIVALLSMITVSIISSINLSRSRGIFN